jgi:hypothetical protein
MTNRNRHVVPRDSGWAVKPEGGQRASSIHETQREAIDRGREVRAASIRSSSSTVRSHMFSWIGAIWASC